MQIAGSEADASKTGAQNVIGLSNGPADLAHNANALTGPGDSLRTLLRGQDAGIWDYNTLGTVAPHEFTHILGVDDKPGAVLSNTNILNDPSIPHHATASDFRWGVKEAVDSVNLNRDMRNWESPYRGLGPSNSPISTTVTVGAPIIGWWK